MESKSRPAEGIYSLQFAGVIMLQFLFVFLSPLVSWCGICVRMRQLCFFGITGRLKKSRHCLLSKPSCSNTGCLLVFFCGSMLVVLSGEIRVLHFHFYENLVANNLGKRFAL